MISAATKVTRKVILANIYIFLNVIMCNCTFTDSVYDFCPDCFLVRGSRYFWSLGNNSSLCCLYNAKRQSLAPDTKSINE